jgi:hypothetical protein
MNSTLKSIWAVLAGMILIVILSVVTDLILESAGVFPPQDQYALYVPWMHGLALIYRCLYGVAGGYLTASLSPANPVRHSVILGIIGTLVSIMGMVVMWGMSANWYPIALVITALPTTWLGAKLMESRIVTIKQ